MKTRECRYDLSRGFVFDLLSQRLASVMTIVDEVAFRRMDTRLASFLMGRSRVENPIRITHQAIAVELGSSREVFSRILEDFSDQGLIRLARGMLVILVRARSPPSRLRHSAVNR